MDGWVVMSYKRETRTILIIEDEVNIQNFISRTLELEGYSVLRSTDGTSGLKSAMKDRVSLVLLDLRLRSGPDGWSILRKMKRDPNTSGIPVVVLTASAEAAQRRRTLRLGADNYLVKPISARNLIRAVREALKKKTAIATARRLTSPATS
jgi:DNA-binding response OmpR family regulator